MISYQTKMSWEGGVGLHDTEIPTAKKGQVLIKLNYAGLNRRDYKIKQGWYLKNYTFGSILGSDGSGKVVEVKSKLDSDWLGKDVIINPNILWGDNDLVPSPEYTILGMPNNGTLAEYVVVGIDRIHGRPNHLSMIESAALPLASLTAYRAIVKKAQLLPKQNILITGAGGGVAQMAIKFSLGLGANVFVTSGHESKIERVKNWGVVDGVNYKSNNWDKELLGKSGAFDVVLDSSGSDQINTLLKLLKPNGKYVFYGATNGSPKKFDLSKIYYNQLQIVGTLMGSDSDFSNMLDFVSQNGIKPEIEKVFPIKEIDHAFKIMEEQSQFGKIVIQL